MLRRIVIILLVVLAALAGVAFLLDRADLLTPISPSAAQAMAPAIACNGRAVAEGFTYKVHDPEAGDIVAFHQGGSVRVARVIGLPGDTVAVRSRRVFVDGHQADDIPTPRLGAVTVSSREYFLLGDNRALPRARWDVGTVPRSAIFGRVFFVWWPLGHFGAPGGTGSGAPPGNAC